MVDLIDREAEAPAGATSWFELKIGILLWPEFPLLSLAGFLDALRHAADRADDSRKLRCTWTIMGPSAGHATVSSCGVTIRADEALQDPRQFHYIGVIGGLLRSLDTAPAENVRYLQAAAEAGTPLIGICTGSFVLAHQQLMTGRGACLHPYHFNEFRQMFPRIRAITNRDYLEDGNRLTCAGGISIISLATHLIARHCGQDRATKVIHQMTVPNRAEASSVAQSQAIGYTRIGDLRVRHAVFLMEQALIRRESTQSITAKVGLSSRQLERLFQAEFGQSPAAYLRAARLRYARWLLQNSDETVTEIALRIGFSDCAHFVRQFSVAFGVSPGRFRQAQLTAGPDGGPPGDNLTTPPSPILP